MAGDPYPKVWKWSHEAHPRPLSNWAKAPESSGYYELGKMKNGSFQPKYCGRAAGVTLRARLRQHYLHSHNENVRLNSAQLLYRCKEFDTFELACYVEAVCIAAFEYPWNKRNEWGMHWILES